jgi:hypothetical protein
MTGPREAAIFNRYNYNLEIILIRLGIGHTEG